MNLGKAGNGKRILHVKMEEILTSACFVMLGFSLVACRRSMAPRDDPLFCPYAIGMFLFMWMSLGDYLAALFAAVLSQTAPLAHFWVTIGCSLVPLGVVYSTP